jgi:hypothetical protein
VVRDHAGSPVAGAIVSAVGGRTAVGTTDADGRCTLSLPAGEYLLRVHRVGFGTPNSSSSACGSGAIAAHDVVLSPSPPAEGPTRRAGRHAGAGRRLLWRRLALADPRREVVVDEIAIPTNPTTTTARRPGACAHPPQRAERLDRARRLDDDGSEFDDGAWRGSGGP